MNEINEEQPNIYFILCPDLVTEAWEIKVNKTTSLASKTHRSINK
jgi:hypothetical protein